MMTEEYKEQITIAAENNLKTSLSGIEYVATEQGGLEKGSDLFVSAQAHNRIASLTGITELTAELRAKILTQAEQGELSDFSKANPQKVVISNQLEFTREFLKDNPDILIKLAEIQAKIQIFEDVTSGEIAESSQTVTDLNQKVAAWKHTIVDMAQRLSPDPQTQSAYEKNVQDNLHKLSQSRIVMFKDSQGNSIPRVDDSYKDRLGKLLHNPRAERLIAGIANPNRGEELSEKVVDEFLETAYTLNAIRVLDRIQKPLTYDAQFGKLIDCLDEAEFDPKYQSLIDATNLKTEYKQYQIAEDEIKKSSLSYDDKNQKLEDLEKKFKEQCRPLIETHLKGEQDESIDLLATKQSIADLRVAAQQIKDSPLDQDEKNRQLSLLDSQLESLLVPIANKVARVFPHKRATNLTEILENEEAVCAGKVNALLVISQFLGVKGRAVAVRELLDKGTQGHVYFEADLLSSRKLVIDSNFSTKSGMPERTDEEYIERMKQKYPHMSNKEIKSKLSYYRLALANSRLIHKDSRVLIYKIENTGNVVQTSDQIQGTKDEPHLFIRLNPYTGKKEIWRSSVPYPHLSTMPDKDGFTYINASFCNNTAMFAGKDYQDVAVYLLRKQIKLHPFDARAHAGYALRMGADFAVSYFENIKATNPDLFWDGIFADLALQYSNQGNLDKVDSIYAELKNKDINAYYKGLESLARLYETEAYKRNSGGQKDQELEIQERARIILESARAENPHLFYSEKGNVPRLMQLYYEDPNARIQILEDILTNYPQLFWEDNKYFLPPDKLADLYISEGYKDPTQAVKLDTLFQMARSRNPEFYVKNIHKLVSLYIYGNSKNPERAFSILESIKQENPTGFYSEADNITSLVTLYQNQGDKENAKKIFEEAKQLNPEVFWNGHFSLYASMIRNLVEDNEVNSAITLAEEAKVKSVKFWEGSPRSGYAQLIDLYVSGNKLDEALQTSLEARDKDLKFYNPSHNDSGYIQLASIYNRLGQADKAIETLLSGSELDENYWKSSYFEPHVSQLAELYANSGKPQEAIDIYKEIRNKNPEDYSKFEYYKITGLLIDTGLPDQAEKVRDELIGIYSKLRLEQPSKPRDYNYWSNGMQKLAYLYDQGGNTLLAIEVLEEGKAGYEYFQMKARYSLIDLYLKVGDKGKAIDTYQGIIEVAKKNNHPERIPQIVEEARAQGLELQIAA